MKILLTFLFVVLSWPTLAQDKTATNKPVEIEASQQLEWLRNDNTYRATGDVVITQGDTTIKGDKAEAQYNPDVGPSELTTITVTGHVMMTEADRTITADEAVYDTKAEILTLHGANTSVTATDLNVTSTGGMVYDALNRKAVATGDAVVKQPGQTLKAQHITAWFDADNKLQRAVAKGNVVILRGTQAEPEIIQADHGDYDLTKNNAVLTGNVKLTRGQNHMQGDIATIDLKTGYSSLQNNEAQGGARVRAIFNTAKSPS